MILVFTNEDVFGRFVHTSEEKRFHLTFFFIYVFYFIWQRILCSCGSLISYLHLYAVDMRKIFEFDGLFFLPLQLEKRRTPFFKIKIAESRSCFTYGCLTNFSPFTPMNKCVLFLINFTLFCRSLMIVLSSIFFNFFMKTPCCRAHN